MLTKKKKISRKEIKEDKLVTTYYKSIEFFNENKSKVYLYGGILIVVIFVAYFYMQRKEGQNQKATLALSRVMELYENGAYQDAIDGRPASKIDGLKKIVDDFGSTETGEVAKVLLANCYNFLGKYEEAYEYYDDYDGDIKIYKATSLAGIGSYFEYKNEPAKAANYYKEAAYTDKANAMNADYLLKAGINYLNANENEEAVEMFEKVKEDYKTSGAFREVERYLAAAK